MATFIILCIIALIGFPKTYIIDEKGSLRMSCLRNTASITMNCELTDTLVPITVWSKSTDCWPDHRERAELN